MTYAPAATGSCYAHLPQGAFVRGMWLDSVPMALAAKIAEQRASMADVVALFEQRGAGRFWGGADGDWGVAAAIDHASEDQANLLLGAWASHPEYRTEDETAGYGVSVVLVVRPHGDFEQDTMGGSYYGLRPEGVEMDLVEVYLDYGDGWKVMPHQSGLRVTSMTAEAGPASDTVPLGRFPVEAPEPEDFGPNTVVVLKPAAKDIAALPKASRALVEAAIAALRAGRARSIMEPKEREPLLGTYTLRVTPSLRVGFYLSGEGDDWYVYGVTEHNYAELERRFWQSPGYVRFAAPQHQRFRRAASAGPEPLLVDGHEVVVRANRVVPNLLHAEIEGRTVGSISWSDGAIARVEVDPAYRRKGIATLLLAHARQEEPGLAHSTNLTDDGKAWSEKTASPYFIHDVDEPLIDTAPMAGFEQAASFDFITPQIATGGSIRRRSDLLILARRGVTGIVSGRSDFDDALLNDPAVPHMATLWLATHDDGAPKPVSWFKDAIDFCLPRLRRGEGVYLHCKGGVNRGPSLAYAVLRAFTGMGHAEAFAKITAARPSAEVGYAKDADKALVELGYAKAPAAGIEKDMNPVPHWRQATRTTASGPTTLYRGVGVDLRHPGLDEALDRYMAMPQTEEERGQKFMLGPILLDAMGAGYEDNYGKVGLGRHWTSRKDFAERAARTGGPYGNSLPVIVTAEWDGHTGLDIEGTGIGGASAPGFTPWDTEEETTLLPGTSLEVTSVKVRWLQGWVEVLKTPMRVHAATTPYRDTTMGREALKAISMHTALSPDSPKIRAMAADIKAHGIKDPLLVQQTRTDPFLMDGHHRLLAGEVAGLDTFPVRIFDSSEEGIRAGSRALIEADARRDDSQWERTAALDELASWRPTTGMFSPGEPTLDPRVFTGPIGGEIMRPEVRAGVLGDLDAFMQTNGYEDWRDWTSVYLAGSGASFWWNSDTDFDILLGLDLPALVASRPANAGLTEEEVCRTLTAKLKDGLDLETAARWYAPDSGPWGTTYFYNPGSKDIRNLKPYAAYDLLAGDWVVHPPILPADWGPGKFDNGTWERCEQIAAEAIEVLAIADPAARAQAGTAFFDMVHAWRHLAYTPAGRGWLDFGNVLYQYLNLRPDGILRALYLCKHPEIAVTAAVPGLTFERTSVGDPMGERMLLNARINGTLAGYVRFHESDYDDEVGDLGYVPVIDMLEVNPDFARRGVARALFEHLSQEYGVRPTASEFTPDGAAMWKALTGESVRPTSRSSQPRRRNWSVGARTANMGYYMNEWREQAALGKTHDLNVERTGAQLRAFAKKVLAAEDPSIAFTLKLTRGVGWSDAEVIDGKAVLNIDSGTSRTETQRNYWTVLHECAHIICELSRGMDDWDSDHGPGFRTVFQELLNAHGASTVKIAASRTAGANGSLPAGLTYLQRPARTPEGAAAHMVQAFVDHKEVGHLTWLTENAANYVKGEIYDVEVDPSLRRRGLASALLFVARGIDPDVRHSSVVTNDGAEWAIAVGSLKTASQDFVDPEASEPAPAYGWQRKHGPQALWGAGKWHAMFGDSPTTTAPWEFYRFGPKRPKDKAAIAAVIANPGPHMRSVDPRGLYATQGDLTRQGVAYYLYGDYARTGRTFADQDNLGNAVPVLYHTPDGKYVILSGHHRAAAALLQGRPLRAAIVESTASDHSAHRLGTARRDSADPLRDAQPVPGPAVPAGHPEGVHLGGGGRGDRVGLGGRAAAGGLRGGRAHAERAGGLPLDRPLADPPRQARHAAVGDTLTYDAPEGEPVILTGFSGEPDAQLAAIRAEHPDALIVPGTVGITDSAWWGRAQHLAAGAPDPIVRTLPVEEFTKRFRPTGWQEWSEVAKDLATERPARHPDAPVKVDKDGYLMDGHHRLERAMRLGLPVPYVVVDVWPPPRRLAAAVKDQDYPSETFYLPTRVVNHYDPPTEGSLGDEGWNNARLRDDMRTHGVKEPIEVGMSVADTAARGDRQVLAFNGNHRVAVARELGITALPCINSWAEDAEPLTVARIKELGGSLTSQHLASQESLESCYTEGMSEKTSAETVRTVRKDSTDRVTGERKRGRTHQVNDPFSGQTWCGRKPRGLAHRNYHDDPANVDCPDCLSAIETGRPKPYSRR